MNKNKRNNRKLIALFLTIGGFFAIVMTAMIGNLFFDNKPRGLASKASEMQTEQSQTMDTSDTSSTTTFFRQKKVNPSQRGVISLDVIVNTSSPEENTTITLHYPKDTFVPLITETPSLSKRCSEMSHFTSPNEIESDTDSGSIHISKSNVTDKNTDSYCFGTFKFRALNYSGENGNNSIDSSQFKLFTGGEKSYTDLSSDNNQTISTSSDINPEVNIDSVPCMPLTPLDVSEDLSCEEIMEAGGYIQRDSNILDDSSENI